MTKITLTVQHTHPYLHRYCACSIEWKGCEAFPLHASHPAESMNQKFMIKVILPADVELYCKVKVDVQLINRLICPQFYMLSLHIIVEISHIHMSQQNHISILSSLGLLFVMSKIVHAASGWIKLKSQIQTTKSWCIPNGFLSEISPLDVVNHLAVARIKITWN